MNDNPLGVTFSGLQKMAHISSIVAQKPGKGFLNSSLPNSEEDLHIVEAKKEDKKESI